MSYTELEYGYQGLKRSRPGFYIGTDLDSHLRQAPVSFNFCNVIVYWEAFMRRKS